MDFKKISELFTVAVPLLIICSCIRLMTYYHNWNIPILDYLSAPELLFLFVRPAITIIALAAIYFAANAALVGIVYMVVRLQARYKQSAKEKSGANEKTETETPSEKVNETKGVWGWFGSLVPVLVFLFGIWVFVEAIWFKYEILPVVILHVGIWFAAILTIQKVTEPGRDGASLQTVLLGSMIMLISASYFVGRYEVNATTTNPVPHSIVLKDGSSIATDANLIYLGKTSNYYFLYNNAANRASIIPAAEATRIEIAR